MIQLSRKIKFIQGDRNDTDMSRKIKVIQDDRNDTVEQENSLYRVIETIQI